MLNGSRLPPNVYAENDYSYFGNPALLEIQHECPFTHISPEKPGMLSTQDCPLKGIDIKPVLLSRNLGIGSDS